MNNLQKRVLIAIGAVVLIMLLYPPYVEQAGRFNVHTGYAFLFKLPAQATVNAMTLIVQWLGVSIVGGIAYFILKTN